MGIHFTDKYSLLHFGVGIVAYYWNISFIAWFVLHVVYEYIENTEYGMKLINRFYFSAGGKDHADSLTNILGDQTYGILGWIVAYLVCR